MAWENAFDQAAWADRDIYISGPDAMIAKTVQVLKDRGAPGHLIRTT